MLTYFNPRRQVRQWIDRSAVAAGFDGVSDYLASLAAEHVGLPALAPKPRLAAEQSQLPLSPTTPALPANGDDGNVKTYFRPHRRVREALEREQLERGYVTLSDFVTALACGWANLPELAPTPAPATDQETFSMTG